MLVIINVLTQEIPVISLSWTLLNGVRSGNWQGRKSHKKKKKDKKSKDDEKDKEICAYCFNCGRSHGKVCPAYGYRCSKCKEYNHYAWMCNRDSDTSDSSDNEEKGAKGGARRGQKHGQKFHHAGYGEEIVYDDQSIGNDGSILFGSVTIEGNDSDNFVFS